VKKFFEGLALVLAVLGIVALDGYALYLGHDGQLLALSVGALAGIAGFKIKGLRFPGQGNGK